MKHKALTVYPQESFSLSLIGVYTKTLKTSSHMLLAKYKGVEFKITYWGNYVAKKHKVKLGKLVPVRVIGKIVRAEVESYADLCKIEDKKHG